MKTFTTCRRCRGLLRVTNGDVVHPLCTPRPTRFERLEAELAAAVAAGDEVATDRLVAEMEKLENEPPDLRAAALRYATEFGWPVFPLRPEGHVIARRIKGELVEDVSDGKHPGTRNGFKDATRDPARIDAWWDREPRFNVGTPTGLAFDVIDVDTAKGDRPSGEAAYAALMADDEVAGDVHGETRTWSGGRHVLVEPTGEGNMAGFVPGCDYRGLGGYVVLPPSVIGRKRYTWTVAPSPAITRREEK